MANHAERPKTIAANGEIISKPYGMGRWHSPRHYGCAHPGCDGAAEITARSGDHESAPGKNGAHNCCGAHRPDAPDTTAS